MRIATLQFSPELGEVSANIALADEVLSRSPPPSEVDLLVLPELAFTGYNHTPDSILPYLEPTANGLSTIWAKATAGKYNCVVSVGYPERFTRYASNDTTLPYELIAYNSTVTISPSGEVLAHYRKTHLYYTDEGWAKEGPEGWLVKDIPLRACKNETVRAAFGICMDLNPYKFEASWEAYEFCKSAQSTGAAILVLSMAWISSLPAAELSEFPGYPDMGTFSYWISRLMPFLDEDKEVIVVCANRTGEEPGRNPCGQIDDGVRYAGTSWIGRIGKGKIDVWSMMGRGSEGLQFGDTETEPSMAYCLEKRAPQDETTNSSNG